MMPMPQVEAISQESFGGSINRKVSGFGYIRWQFNNPITVIVYFQVP